MRRKRTRIFRDVEAIEALVQEALEASKINQPVRSKAVKALLMSLGNPTHRAKRRVESKAGNSGLRPIIETLLNRGTHPLSAASFANNYVPILYDSPLLQSFYDAGMSAAEVGYLRQLQKLEPNLPAGQVKVRQREIGTAHLQMKGTTTSLYAQVKSLLSAFEERTVEPVMPQELTEGIDDLFIDAVATILLQLQGLKGTDMTSVELERFFELSGQLSDFLFQIRKSRKPVSGQR